MEESPLLLRLSGLSIKQAVFFGLVLAGAFYLTLYDDGAVIEAQIAATSKELVEERKKVEETRRLVAQQEDLREQVKTLGDNLRITLSRLPTELNSFRLVRDIQRIARAAGAQITSIKPEAPNMTTYYEEVPVEVQLQGQYKDLVTFLYYVSGLERITRIRDFQLQGASAGRGASSVQSDNPVLTMRAEVVSFRYVPVAVTNTDGQGAGEDGGQTQ